MSDSLLKDVENVVDDFCSKGHNKINTEYSSSKSSTSASRSPGVEYGPVNWNGRRYPREIGILGREYQNEYHGPYDNERARNNEFKVCDDFIKCYCGVTVNFKVKRKVIRDWVYNKPLQEIERWKERVSDFYCQKCSAEWRTLGDLVSISVDLSEEKERRYG